MPLMSLIDMSLSWSNDTDSLWSGLGTPLIHFMKGRMIVEMRPAISEIFSIICSNVDQKLPVSVVGVTRSTHFTIV